MEVDRNEEFAPVKNEESCTEDSPSTARAMISSLAVKWLADIGAKVIDENGNEVLPSSIPRVLPANSNLRCEISKALTYEGEGLGHLSGKTIQLPCFYN